MAYLSSNESANGGVGKSKCRKLRNMKACGILLYELLQIFCVHTTQTYSTKKMLLLQLWCIFFLHTYENILREKIYKKKCQNYFLLFYLAPLSYVICTAHYIKNPLRRTRITAQNIFFLIQEKLIIVMNGRIMLLLLKLNRTLNKTH